MFKRCNINDLDHINGILRSQDVYPFITDDFSPTQDLFNAKNIMSIEDAHIICPDNYSVIIFIPKNGITWGIHYHVLKAGRGINIRNITPKVLDYAFEEIENCKKLVCSIAEIHKNVIDFATEMGMRHEGRITKSIQKNGILYDEIILGMRKTQWE